MTRRALVAAAGVVAILAYVWLAVQVWRAQADPETFRAWNGPSAWIVGPSGKSLLDAADLRIEQAITALNDTSHPPDERLRNHRSHLKTAEDLLIRSLRAEPAQPAALARLAAVRWELDPPVDERALRRGLELVDLAASLAPDAPRVRLQLGELLMRAGRTDDALVHLRRAVELDPASAKRAVAALRIRWIPASSIYAALPSTAQVLVELKPAFLQDGTAGEFLTLAGPGLHTAPPSLLEAFGDVALAGKEPGRLVTAMAELAPFPEPDRESERQIQLARGLVASKRGEEAVTAARAARALAPGDSRIVERAGRVALEAKAPEFALDAFRDALTLAARANGSATRRAILYREIGQAEDASGRQDRAYTAYLQALRLDPAEPIAKQRVEQLEKAAGVR